MDNSAARGHHLLVEFDFLVDMDLAMYNYVRLNYKDSPYVDPELMSLDDEREVMWSLLYRKHINPLEIIIPEMDTTDLYNDLLENHEEELLKYARAYDTFPLMVTYLNRVQNIYITIWCRNKIEENYIKSLNARFKTIVKPNRHQISLIDYSSIYVKYLAFLIEYSKVQMNGKHIYFAAAGFNMEEDKDMVKVNPTALFSDTNEFHMIDLYKYVKYRFKKEDEGKDT